MKARKVKDIESVENEIKKGKKEKIYRITGALMVGLIAWAAMLYAANSIINESRHIEVCVAKADIPDGTRITQDNIATYIGKVSVTENVLPAGYIEDESQLIDYFIQRDYLQNEIITTSSISSVESMTRHIQNPIEISVAVASIDAAVGGILREGDYINIYSVGSTLSDSNAQLIINNAYVTKALDSSGMEITRANNQSNATVINLIIPMDIEQRFNKELLSGTVRMSLVYNPDISNISTIINESMENNMSENMVESTELQTFVQDSMNMTTEDTNSDDTSNEENTNSEEILVDVIEDNTEQVQ